MQGGENDEKIDQKRKYINEIIAMEVPLAIDITVQYIPQLLHEYGELGKGVSLTDFFLAATAVKHYRDLSLFTKNPHDFPTTIFSLQSHVVIEMKKALQVYGVYNYPAQQELSPKEDEFIPF